MVGVNCPSRVVSIAPASPIIAEPRIKISRCRAFTFFPIALAEISLSLIARIIRPHGDFSATSDKINSVSTTIENKKQ